MKLKVSKLRNDFFFFLLLSIIFLSCNKDFNTVGYDLISTNAFETDKIKLPVFSYQKESLTDIQTNGLPIQQLGTIDVPNVGGQLLTLFLNSVYLPLISLGCILQKTN